MKKAQYRGVVQYKGLDPMYKQRRNMVRASFMGVLFVKDNGVPTRFRGEFTLRIKFRNGDYIYVMKIGNSLPKVIHFTKDEYRRAIGVWPK